MLERFALDSQRIKTSLKLQNINLETLKISNMTNILVIFSNVSPGHTNDDKLRNQAASGGLCTVFLRALLDSGKVDGVICVRPVNDPKRLFEFFIATSYETSLFGSQQCLLSH